MGQALMLLFEWLGNFSALIMCSNTIHKQGACKTVFQLREVAVQVLTVFCLHWLNVQGGSSGPHFIFFHMACRGFSIQ